MAVPNALLQSLEKAPGFNLSDFVAVHESDEQVVSIRTNPNKATTALTEYRAEQVPWCEHGYYLNSRPIFTADPLLHAGAYYVQEASSMFLWHILKSLIGSNTIGKRVLDLCAAPGGKSSLLLSYFTDGLVVSNEVIKNRVSILEENITKWGSVNSIITNNDPSHFKKLTNFFDLIVVDAPCSGSGLFRKDPTAIEEWSVQNVELCSERQERILADILPSLTEGGYLMYSTCSYSLEEDEDISNWLIDEMNMEPVNTTVPSNWGIVATSPAGFRFYPDKVKGEGFYMAVFQKKSNDTSTNNKTVPFVKPTTIELQAVATYITLPENYFYFKHQETIRVFPINFLDSLQAIAACLYIKKAGVAIGTLKGKDLVPEHEYAVSIVEKPKDICVDVDETTALAYLRKKDIQLNISKGWQLICYNTLPIGWVKGLGNRVNNYYPAEWRIRKDTF